MSGYIGSKASVVSSGAERKKTYSITGTTTVLTGASYTPNQVHVFHNGVRLVDGTDYTATDGSTVTLTTAAENGDEVVVISYATFSPADTYTKTEADSRYVNTTGDTMTGALVGTDLTLSGGVYLGGTGAANKLDDYEEGTWTPIYQGDTTAGTYTYSENQGVYTKIGNMVYASFNFTNITTSSAGSGAIKITGLPFSTGGYPSGFNIDSGMVDISFHSTGGNHTYPVVWENNNYFYVQTITGTSSQAAVAVTDKTSNGADIRGMVIYQTA